MSLFFFSISSVNFPLTVITRRNWKHYKLPGARKVDYRQNSLSSLQYSCHFACPRLLFVYTESLKESLKAPTLYMLLMHPLFSMLDFVASRGHPLLPQSFFSESTALVASWYVQIIFAIHEFIFFKLASGRNPPNPAI